MPRRLRIGLLAAAAALVAALAVAVIARRSHSATPAAEIGSAPAASGFDGAALPTALPARDFALRDVLSRQSVSLASYRGQVAVLAFPYSTCGASCTLLAQQIRGALDELSRPVAVLFISADPHADSPRNVRRFLSQVSLTGRAHYLSGSAAQLRAAWHAYGVVPASAGRAAYASHSAVFLLGPDGGERVVFGLEQLTPEGLAHDICKLGRDCG